MAAIRVSRQIAAEGRSATVDEQTALAGWSSWGAIPQIFDQGKTDWAPERAELRGLLTDRQWDQASRTTLNAHYTDPSIVAAVWQSLVSLGLAQDANVLEPGSGSGTFLGMAPHGVAMVGVELDEVTAGISQQLYPQAQIRAESFADTRFELGSFDAAIGNVPFADVVLHDPIHNAGKYSMHNHFVLKSVDLVRPGGMVAVLTSAYTMDAINPAARKAIFEKADLVGAVRLPTGAHRRTAGTEALTDLLILRKRELDQEPGPDGWLRTGPFRTADGTVANRRVNRHFLDNPGMVLGEMSIGSGMYGSETLHVRNDLEQLPARLNDALGLVTEHAAAEGLRFVERSPELDRAERPTAIEKGSWVGMVIRDGLEYQVTTRTGLEPLAIPRTQRDELNSLLTMRDLAHGLLDLEATSIDDTGEMTEQRTQLREHHQAYVNRWGPINRYKLSRTGRLDKETGEEVMKRNKPPVMRWIRDDPYAALIRALEIFDDETQAVRPAALLTERVVVPRVPIMGADTPEDAIAVALDTDGRLTLDRVADLLGIEPESARLQLGTLAFDDPDTEDLVHRAEYLSGNVRVKLDAAQAAVDAGRDQFQVNVLELEAVLPPKLGPQEIAPRIGAAWISAEDHQNFVREILDDQHAQVQTPDGVMWEVKAKTWGAQAVATFGTTRRPAGALMQSLLNASEIKVEDADTEGRRSLNTTETEAAREKAEALQERFADWIWESPERASRLTDQYNRQFNSLVLRDYSTEGERLTFPGLAATWTPRPHQKAAVARMLAEPAVGLFHQVGAGKTAEMIMGAMELRRLGMANKPVTVVPNHMLDQFSRDWLQLYPQARILAASSDDTKQERRRDLIARIATGDWDGIVITHSAFTMIQVSAEASISYQEAQIREFRKALEHANESDQSDSMVKRVEKKILRAEERHKELLDLPKDPGLTFEATGIDYLIVDEGHLFKNLATESLIPGASIEGAKRSSDLHMKADLLRQIHGERVITMATATPIANSVTEAHVMMRYLRPDLLQAAGVENFDVWAKTFGETVTALELSPTGTGYKSKTRFARFQNVPELLRIWSMFADVKTAEDLNLPTPAMRERPDGLRRPVTITVPPTPELVDFVVDLGGRAEKLSGRAEKGADNLLKIIGEGRHAALDLRLVGQGEPSGPTKLTAAADRITATWRNNRDRQYLDETGQISPIPGALQIVFSDLGVPKEHRFNVYSELKTLLIERGMPSKAIQFAQDAKSDVDKARLFAACRSGEVAVIIGSTPTMGVGTNIQARAIALHHLDATWRPADIEQRDGRILRQGNQNPEVEIVRWVSGRSFDTYMWQTLERKQTFISQLMRGSLDVREIEDIGDASLSLAETKALAADDPLLLEQATVEAEVAKLSRLDRAYHRQESMLSMDLEQASKKIRQVNDAEAPLQALIERAESTAGENFVITVNGVRETTRPKAQDLLVQAIGTSRAPVWQATDIDVEIQLGGLAFRIEQLPPKMGERSFRAHIADHPGTEHGYVFNTAAMGEGISIIRGMESQVGRLPATLNGLRRDRDRAVKQEIDVGQAMGQPFKHATALQDARNRLMEVNKEMSDRANKLPAKPDPGAAIPNPPTPQRSLADRVREILDQPQQQQPAVPVEQVDETKSVSAYINESPATHRQQGPVHR